MATEEKTSAPDQENEAQGEEEKKKETSSTAIGCLAVVIILVVLGFFFGGSAEDITEDEAWVICKNRFKAMARYDWDVFSTGKRVTELKDRWIVYMPGKLQNGFGAWSKVTAQCVVLKKNPNPDDEYSQQAIESFTF